MKKLMYLIANYPEETLDFLLSTQDELLLYYYNKAYSKLMSTTRYYKDPEPEPINPPYAIIEE